MQRALRVRDAQVLFEVDSMLLARHMAHYQPWACRSENLLGAHFECMSLGTHLSDAGISWDVRHATESLTKQPIHWQTNLSTSSTATVFLQIGKRIRIVSKF